MIRKVTFITMMFLLSAVIAACGTEALPPYDVDATSVSVAQTETREALVTQGAIIPTNTPTITPSPTVDFEATELALQATADAQATIDAQAELDAQATADAQAELDAQATVDAEVAAQAAIDAQAEALGLPAETSDDPIYELVALADPVNGEALFNAVEGGAPCTSCHLITEETLVGPGQYNLVARSVERIEDGTIEAEGALTYIYESIVAPGDYITEGFANAMPANYGDLLSDEELYDLIAYLATLSD